MRNFIVCFVIAACTSALSSADAAFVIKLRNGNEFVTGRYWQEGRQVMFDTYGGVFGIDKAFVIKIEQSDKPVKLASPLVEPREIEPETDRANGDDRLKKPAKFTEAPAKAKLDDPIMKDFYALKEKFNGLDGMLTSEIIEFSRNISDFKRKVQTSAKSNDYLNEFTEAFKMGDALEAALKSRGQ